ncbi:MAG: hypothetical protein HXX16_10140 [Bacteroidales bacterium]|nr:hypothetical protein [Bacteroidales bacterium]
MKEKLFALIIFIALFTSCKKEEIDNRSYKLTLLQHEWKPISSWIFLRNGSIYRIIPFNSTNFKPDGKVVCPYYTSDPSLPYPYLRLEYYIQGYQLLPDDSTLLFYQIVNGVQSTKADTSIILTLTNQQLIFYSINKKFIRGLDSLKR